MKDITKNKIYVLTLYLEKNLKIIENESKKIFIVNAGRMNHGKSSLFNSLLDKQYFATGDVRTTVARSDAEFRPNVFLVDTPGLDAVDCDDKVAFDAYKKANMVEKRVLKYTNIKVGFSSLEKNLDKWVNEYDFRR